jgi:hypothetical protein
MRTIVPATYLLRRFSKGMVRERLEAGSTAEDLFYYLVSLLPDPIQVFFILDDRVKTTKKNRTIWMRIN